MTESGTGSRVVSRLAHTTAIVLWSGVLFATAMVLQRLLVSGSIRTFPVEVGLFLITIAFASNLLAAALYRWSESAPLSHGKQSAMTIITLLAPGLLALSVFPPVSVAFAAFQGVLFLAMTLCALSWEQLSPKTEALTVSETEKIASETGPEALTEPVLDGDSQSDLPITLAFPEPEETAVEPEEELFSPEEGRLTHWMQRYEMANGDESLEGTLRVKFAAKHKMATAHLPFVPPFSMTPQVQCEVMDDSGARVKVAAVHPYGARIEVRRNGDVSEECDLMIHVSALAGVSARRAA